jgi:hypothetical protein
MPNTTTSLQEKIEHITSSHSPQGLKADKASPKRVRKRPKSISILIKIPNPISNSLQKI